MSEDKTYIMIDRKTRWSEAVPLSNIYTSNVAKHLIATWISRYGVPNHIITDQGTQLKKLFFDSLSRSFGLKHVHTTAYHPQANGLIERFYRSLKTSLRCLSTSATWTQSLPLVTLGWRNTVYSATGTTPATLLFGTGTTLPNDFLTQSSTPSLEALDSARKHCLSTDTNPSFGPKSLYKPYISSSLKTADYVWIQAQQIHHLNPRYSCPFKVLEFRDNNTVIIIRDGKPQTINLDKIKPAYGFSYPQNQTKTSDNEVLHKPPANRPTATQSCENTPPKKKSVSFTNFVRIWDPNRPKYLPFRCIHMKE